MDKVKAEDAILYSQSALGNGEFTGIRDLVYVKPGSFDAARSREIALGIEAINAKFKAVKRVDRISGGEFEQKEAGGGVAGAKETEDTAGRGYVLVGPGRWGSSDPWLGIPVTWTQISEARLIVESGLENYRIDPSQGTHFFQNLTSFRVGYMTINPYIGDGFYDPEYLDGLPAVYEDEYFRHIQFSPRAKGGHRRKNQPGGGSKT